MKSIRSKIMWMLFCSVLIASLIIGLLGVMLTSNIIKESSTENMRLLCKNNADKIDITLAKVEESVNTLAHYVGSELPSIKLLKDEAFREKFSADVSKNALHHIESIDGAAAVYLHYDHEYIGKTDGFYYVKYDNSTEFEYSPLIEVSAYSQDESEQVGWWYIPTVSKNATWVEAYYDANIGRYIISYVVPIYKDEKLVGVIGADISTSHLEKLVKEVTVFNSGQGAILKSDGTVIYHPNFDRGELIGKGDPGFKGVIEKLTSEDNTKELISYQLKGEKKKLASSKLRNGMLMVCFAPEAEIYQQQITHMYLISGITVIVGFSALLVAFLVSGRIARPIKKLNEAAKHLSDGEFDFDVEANSVDEIGELTKTFIETRKILKKQIHLLDKEAHLDGLTGVGNKSAFMDAEKKINEDIAAGIADFSVVVFDVNKLKVANDVFGHMAGDKLLVTIANYLRDIFDVSNVFRMGGDEYVVIINECDGVDSTEKIMACVEGMKVLSVEDYPECNVSCAFGFSRLDKMKDHQLSDVLRRADKEMYKNKSETKKVTYPWQEGYKGIKQLQIDKYCELLQTLKESTDDSLYLLNIESGFIRFFGDSDKTFNVLNEGNDANKEETILNYVHSNDRALIEKTIASVVKRDTEKININFRMNINNTVRWVNCRGNVIKDETDSHFVVIGRISQNAVKHLYNPITTLFNKTKLKLDLQADVLNFFNSLMLIEIDNLSEMNLKHGALYVESVLKMLAEKLENRFAMDRIYHVEKEHFVILLNAFSSKEIEELFEEIKEEVSENFTISASVVPNGSDLYVNAENIYDYAVQILNNSKKNGLGRITFFSKESLLEKISAVELLEEIEESVKNNCNGFHLVYQPQIKVEDYSIVSAETLLRYNSKSKGQVYPDQFIPILEQTGLINEVGLWVAEQSLIQCKQWRKYNPDFKISVNISPKQLEKKGFSTRIINLLSKYSLPGNALIIEITESAQLNEKENVFDVLAELKYAGIQIAIDDFGTGYSNLGNLKRIHANILKVDRVFIKDIKENGYNYKLIYNVMEFAKSNELQVCLEGVETKEELMVLSSLKPDIFQGYLFDRPCSADVIEARYFIKDSEEYSKREDYVAQLVKEKRHALIVNMEMKTILSGLDIGLWIMRFNPQTGEGELHADEILRKLLGINDDITPKECYEYWESRIKDELRDKVRDMLAEVTKSDKVFQFEYQWLHPQNGEVYVRASGRITDKNEETVVLEGFHRVISKMDNSI